jgi:hypothetical protein
MLTEVDKLIIRMGPNQDQHQCEAGLSEGVSEGWNGDGARVMRDDVLLYATDIAWRTAKPHPCHHVTHTLISMSDGRSI